MLHTFVALVEDKPGVLTRVASLFRRLNINIVSLTVGHSERVGVSRMTIVCDSSPTAGHRIAASLYKLENVLEVDDVGQLSHVARELALIKVAATPKTRSMVFELVEVFRARIVDLAPESLMIEITGVESKIEGLIQVLNENGDRILEISRTGRMVMRRGQHTSRVLEAMRVPGMETPDEKGEEITGAPSDALMAEETGFGD
ncbi:MAG TPA: acetolactate synthase small subunit [Acidobacteriaceae bacterium]|jgi:acetolactate synthase-1/3 small subunit|nr:acetolactate synthase small subunit [Acidobacteriaceae bacterium]